MTYNNRLSSWITEGGMERNCILQRLNERITDFTKDEEIARLYQKFQLFGAVDNGTPHFLNQTTFLSFLCSHGALPSAARSPYSGGVPSSSGIDSL